MDNTPAAEPDTLGGYIKAARTRAGLSLAKLAGRIGVSAQAVHQWEADEATPSARALHFLAEALPELSARRLLELIPHTSGPGTATPAGQPARDPGTDPTAPGVRVGDQ